MSWETRKLKRKVQRHFLSRGSSSYSWRSTSAFVCHWILVTRAAGHSNNQKIQLFGRPLVVALYTCLQYTHNVYRNILVRISTRAFIAQCHSSLESIYMREQWKNSFVSFVHGIHIDRLKSKGCMKTLRLEFLEGLTYRYIRRSKSHVPAALMNRYI